jgi:hypothetical protein
MDSQRAAALKQTLRALAAERSVDLRIQANRWTLWCRPTSRSLPDTLPATHYKFEFMEGAESLAELFARLERRYSYMLDAFDGALILEAQGGDNFVVREFFCSQG